MKLRSRFALTTVLVGLPVAASLWWLQDTLRDMAGRESFAQFVLAFMQNGGRETCEADPQTWAFLRHQPPPLDGLKPPNGPGPPTCGPPGPGEPPPGGDRGPPPPRPELFAYRADLTSANPAAPPLDPGLKAWRDSGRQTAVVELPDPRRPTEALLVRMPWDTGPCALILARRPGPPPDQGLLPPTSFWLIPLLAVFAALFLAMGPVVRRVRRLTREVRSSENTRFQSAITVTGGDEIGDLAHAFAEAGRQINDHVARQEQREQALRRFLENTTHDVMIPLTVLQGHLSELREHSRTGSGPESVKAAMVEANYIASLLANLSAAAKIEAGAPDLLRETVELNEVVGRVVARHQPIARQSGVALDYAVPQETILVCGDVTSIEQATSNVVYNAIRHNRAGGHAAVVLEATGNRFSLVVTDDGPGISEPELSRLLTGFAEGNTARQRDPSGHGLGLHIAYQLAALHGWTFGLGRSEFGGLQVEFTGPRLEPRAES